MNARKSLRMCTGRCRSRRPAEGGTIVTLSGTNFFASSDQVRVAEPSVLTHQSLFDGTPEGLKVTDRPVFGVQHHPEASPGPQDSHYLFDRFVALMEANA